MLLFIEFLFSFLLLSPVCSILNSEIRINFSLFLGEGIFSLSLLGGILVFELFNLYPLGIPVFLLLLSMESLIFFL